MAAVAYNLKKLLKFKSSKVITVAKSMEIRTGKGLLSPFFIIRVLLDYQAVY